MRPKNLTTQERNQIVQFLLEGSHDGKLCRGRINEATTKFKTSRRTISWFWAATREQQERGQAVYLQSAKIHISRTKRVHIDLEMISSLELRKRSTVRSLAHGIHRSKSTVGRWIRQGLIKVHTSAIRPDLTAPNKLLRLRFSLEALEVDIILKTLRFRSMHNTVHIDEKWFYMTRGTHRFYLTPEEAEPHRSCKSKKFITKVMFMCAVCRPMFGPDGEVLFDGKIGIFPFTQKVPAQRASKYRLAGTLETKDIASVTKEVVRGCLINKVWNVDELCIKYPTSNKTKWPIGASKFICIQQDNAKPHITNTDPIFRDAANQDGFTFTLVQQPPNSPDTNVNDLGWFRAIQSLQTHAESNTIDQLIAVVHNSFEELSPTSLNNVFLSLQGCMVEIMKVRGENSYKNPRMKKGALIRADSLPLNLEVPEELVRQCLMYLIEKGSSVGIESRMDTLGIHMLEEQ